MSAKAFCDGDGWIIVAMFDAGAELEDDRRGGS